MIIQLVFTLNSLLLIYYYKIAFYNNKLRVMHYISGQV